MISNRRAVLFACITLAVPLAACKLLSNDDKAGADAAAATPAATTASASAAPPTQTVVLSAVPAPSAPPSASEAHHKVVVKLPDGGSATVATQADGSLPPGFSFPTIAGFDAAVLKLPPFDAASIPPLPSGFPKIPGFGQGQGQGGNK